MKDAPRPKLLLFDLDGTLLNQDRSIHSENVESLRSAMSEGIRVGFATGRTLESVRGYQDTLGLNGPHILYNGAKVWDVESQKFIYENLLPFEDALTATKLMRDYKVHANLYANGNVYIEKTSPVSQQSAIKDSVEHTVVGDLHCFISENKVTPVKIMLIAEPEFLMEFKKEFVKMMKNDCSIINSERDYLELMNHGVTKGAALPHVLRHLGISVDEVIAFGDNLNDLELIERAGTGVAMGNAHPDIKALADIVIGDHTTCAIAEFLNERMA